MRAAAIAFIALLVAGVALNFVPMFSYGTATYLQEEFHNQFKKGVEFDYLIMYTGNGPEGITNYGIMMNFSYQGDNVFKTTGTMYTLSGSHVGMSIYLLPGFPFTGDSTLVKSESAIILWNNSSMMKCFFSQKNNVNGGMFSVQIENETQAFGPFPYRGYANYQLASVPGIDYLSYPGWYVLADDLTNDVNYSNLLSFFQVDSSSTLPYNSNIAIGILNDAPQQDWGSWLTLGYDEVFPINIGLISGGILVELVSLRHKG